MADITELRKTVRSLVGRIAETEHQEEWLTDEILSLIASVANEARISEHKLWLSRFEQKNDIQILNWSDERLAQLNQSEGKPNE